MGDVGGLHGGLTYALSTFAADVVMQTLTAKICCRSRLWYAWCRIKSKKTVPSVRASLLQCQAKSMNILTAVKHVVWTFLSHLGKREFLNEDLARRLKDRLLKC